MNPVDLIQELRDGLEGVTPGPWACEPMNVRDKQVDRPYVVGPSEIVYPNDGICEPDRMNDRSFPEDAANMRHIARCHPDNIRTLLDTLASKDTALAEKEEQRASADRAAGQCFEKLVEANESLAEIRAEYLNASHDAMKLAAELALVKKALEEERERNRKMHRRAQIAEALSQSTESLLADWAKVAKERKGGDINLLRFSIALDDIQRARKKIASRALSQDGEERS